MSQKWVVPLRTISRQASRVPQYTSSGSSRRSIGQIFSSSQRISGRSSP
jgi:hypothetical protein